MKTKYQILNKNKEIIQEAKNIRDLAYKWNLLLIWADQLTIIDTKNNSEIDKKIIEDKFNDMVEKSTSIKIKRSPLKGCQTIYK